MTSKAMNEHTKSRSGRVGRLAAYLFPSVLAFLSVLSWFERGKFLATGDVPPFVREGVWAEFGSIWGYQTTAAGSPSMQIVRFPEVFFLQTTQALGIPNHSAQALFLGLLAAALTMAAAYMVFGLANSRLAAASAGLISFFNPYILGRVANPTPLTFWAMILLAALAGALFRAAQGQDVKFPLILVAIGAGYLALLPPFLALLPIWVVLIVMICPSLNQHGLRLAMRQVWRAIPWALGLSSFWLVPVVITVFSFGDSQLLSAQKDVAAWGYAHTNTSIQNVFSLSGHWHWLRKEYAPFAPALIAAPWGFLRFALPTVALLSAILAKKERRGLVIRIMIIATVLLFLAKGLHRPGGEINLGMYRVIPGAWLFRDPFSKLAPCLVLLYAILVGLFLERFRTKLVWQAIATTVVVVAVAFPYPLWIRAFDPRFSIIASSAYVSLPEGWNSIAESINRSDEPGKVLQLPINDFYQMPTTWNYRGTDLVLKWLTRRPVLNDLPGTYYGQRTGFLNAQREIERAILSQTDDVAAKRLASLGVGFIVVRRDIDESFSGRQVRVTDPSDLDSKLGNAPFAQVVKKTEIATLYRVQGETGPISLRPIGVAPSTKAALNQPLRGSYDCANRDSKKARLQFEQLDAFGGSILLSADRHRACAVAAIVPILRDVPLSIRFDVRRLRGSNPTICLYEANLRKCLDTPPVPDSKRWQGYEGIALPDPRTTQLLLYLYSNGTEAEGGAAEFRNVRVSPYLANSETTDLSPRTPEWRRSSLTKYEVTLPKLPQATILTFKDSFDRGWSLQGSSRVDRHFSIDGFANAWIIKPGAAAKVRLVYRPAALSIGGYAISLGTALGLVSALLVRRRRKLRT